MKRKLIHLPFTILCLVFLYGCNNDESSVMELKPVADSNKDLDNELSLIETSWQESQHESLSDITSVNMEVEEGSVNPLGLTLVFENISNEQIIFGEEYILEKKAGKSWYEVPALIDNYGFSETGYDLPFHQSRKLELDWKWLYGDLEPGDYRIIKDVIDFRGSSSYCKDYLAREFAVK